MASTFSQNKGLELPAFNDYIDSWNVPMNSNSTEIDTAFGGTTSLNVTSVSGTVVLTSTQYRPPNINISGLLTAAVTYQVPSGVGGFWFVYNNTTGLFNLTISSGGAGTSVVIVQGTRAIITSDGTNIALSSTAAGGVSSNVQYNSSGTLAGSNSFVFDGTNVGIGTAAPGSRLDVKGTFRLSGSSSGYVALTGAAAAGSTTYTLPSLDGASGQFLTTNGAGTLSWSGVTTGVSSFNAGSTGFTPSTATTGAVTLAGILNVANGGTGAATLTGYLSGNGTSPVTASATIPGAAINGNITGSAGSVTNAATFNNSGSGVTSGTTYNGGTARTISYNTIGAPSTTGANASGTWSISISGSAASASTATSATSATTATTANALNTGNNYQVNSIGIGTAASGTAGEIRATNNITAYYSDDRLKTKLGNIEDALSKLCSLDGFYYEANETAQALGYEKVREVGLSAQSVQAILPEIVAPAPIDEQYLTIRYDRLAPLLVEAIKELAAQIQEIREDLDI